MGSGISLLEQCMLSLEEWVDMGCQNVNGGLGSQIAPNPYDITIVVDHYLDHHSINILCWSLLDAVSSKSLVSMSVHSEARKAKWT